MTEAMPFLQKYDITFLRPPTILQRGFCVCRRHTLHRGPLRWVLCGRDRSSLQRTQLYTKGAQCARLRAERYFLRRTRRRRK